MRVFKSYGGHENLPAPLALTPSNLAALLGFQLPFGTRQLPTGANHELAQIFLPEP